MSLRSALYVGAVLHRRLRPFMHRLRYRVFWILFDLDEIEQLPRRLLLFSHNRFNALSFYDTDHGDGGARPLREQIDGHPPQRGHRSSRRHDPAVVHAANIRTRFQSAEHFLLLRGRRLARCHDLRGSQYVRPAPQLSVSRSGARRPVIEHRCGKEFYVSPFMDMEMTYDFRVALPDEHVSVAIATSDRDGVQLVAALIGRAPHSVGCGTAARPHHSSAADAQSHRRYPLARLRECCSKGSGCGLARSRRRRGSPSCAAKASCRALSKRLLIVPQRDRRSAATRSVWLASFSTGCCRTCRSGGCTSCCPTGQIVERRGEREGPEATIAMRRWRAVWRILFEGEDGFARLRRWRLDDAGPRLAARSGHAQRNGSDAADQELAAELRIVIVSVTRCAPIRAAAAAATSPRITISATTSSGRGSTPA